MLTEKVRIDIQLKFLYPNMILKGDAYDDNDKLILPAETPITDSFIQNLKVNGVKSIHYIHERLKLKKNVTQSMVSDTSINKALEIIDTIEGNIRKKSDGIPQKEVNEIIQNFVTDIRNNEDSCLNLLDMLTFDDYTYTHSINVATISILLGKSLNMDDEKLNMLGVAGLLHDIGKTMVPKEILDKPGKLSPDEWTIMKNHPIYSYNLVHAEGNFNPKIEQAILLHHEAYTGGGYPLGNTHDKLDTFSQVISLSDVFDALTSRRPYKDMWAMSDAFTNLMENSGKKFNPQITQVFLRDMVRKINEEPLYPENSYVLLNTGEVGWVVGFRKSPFSLRPIINIFFNPGRGGDITQQMLKYIQQVDLEQDYSRFIVKRIMDDAYIKKFQGMLGEKAPKPADASAAFQETVIK